MFHYLPPCAVHSLRLCPLQSCWEELELATEELRCAARALGSITGAIETEEVLDAIFSEFCIGK